MKIYLIRHGETDWNKKLKIQGQADIPLNQTGRMQAEIAAKYLDGIQFDAVFSSPLCGQETAKIIIKDRKYPFI